MPVHQFITSSGPGSGVTRLLTMDKKKLMPKIHNPITYKDNIYWFTLPPSKKHSYMNELRKNALKEKNFRTPKVLFSRAFFLSWAFN